MGAWALEHGCKSWTGIELDDDYISSSRDLLSQHYPDHNWSVIQHDALSYVEQSDRRWDMILAAGIIYGYPDSVRFIQSCIAKSDWVVIECAQPWGPALEDQSLRDTASFSVFNARPTIGPSHRQWGFPSQIPSSTFVAQVGDAYGFEVHWDLDQQLRSCLPRHFNNTARGRYCVSLKKPSEIS